MPAFQLRDARCCVTMASASASQRVQRQSFARFQAHTTSLETLIALDLRARVLLLPSQATSFTYVSHSDGCHIGTNTVPCLLQSFKVIEGVGFCTDLRNAGVVSGVDGLWSWQRSAAELRIEEKNPPKQLSCIGGRLSQVSSSEGVREFLFAVLRRLRPDWRFEKAGHATPFSRGASPGRLFW